MRKVEPATLHDCGGRTSMVREVCVRVGMCFETVLGEHSRFVVCSCCGPVLAFPGLVGLKESLQACSDLAETEPEPCLLRASVSVETPNP